MANAKVTLGGKTLMDVSRDTVVPEVLHTGYTATNAAGEKIQGTLNYEPQIQALQQKDADQDAAFQALLVRFNALANSDDATLDQLAELVDYIKANRNLIESITTTKVNVSDIVNDLASSATNKPLSAAQGKALNESKANVTDLNTLRTTVDSKANTTDLGNGTLTIQVNGTTIATFNANQKTGATANIKTTDINNDSSGATTTQPGTIKLGYQTNGKNYAVEVDAEGNAFVKVPWTDTNTTYSVMTGGSATAAGKAGLVPVPPIGAQLKFLRGDGTWQTISFDTSGLLPLTGGKLTGVLEIGNNLKFHSDAEGGNIILTTPDGHQFELDTYSNLLRLFSKNETGGVQNGSILFFTPDGQATFGTVVNLPGIVSSSADGIRMKQGNYSTIFRNDGNNFYLLLTNSGDSDGSWNSYRPFQINFATGTCLINGIKPITTLATTTDPGEDTDSTLPNGSLVVVYE